MPEDSVKIFYTDDDQDDQEIFIDAVNEISDSLQIVTQRNGDELIKMLKSRPPVPSIIFLDLNMPVKNGYEVLTMPFRACLMNTLRHWCTGCEKFLSLQNTG